MLANIVAATVTDARFITTPLSRGFSYTITDLMAGFQYIYALDDVVCVLLGRHTLINYSSS